MNEKINLSRQNEKLLKDPTISLKEKLKMVSFRTDTERQIADYILDHAGDIQNMSVQSLAKACFVGQGTIVRFTQKFGYSGYKQFKNDLIRQTESDKYLSHSVDFRSPFDGEKARTQQIMSSLSSLYRESVDIIQTFADAGILQEIADKIMNCRILYLYAIGDSMITCNLFANRIAKIGYAVNIASQYGDEYEIGRNATEKDVVLFVSYSGVRSDNYVTNARQLHQRGIPIYGFTANPDCYITKYADKCILIRNMEGGRQERIGTFYSQFVFDYLFNVIYSILYVKHQEDL